MKKILFIILLLLVRFTVFSQSTWDIREMNPYIEKSPMLMPSGTLNTWDGAYLNPNLDLRMLNILINIIYDVTPDQDPSPAHTYYPIGWPQVGILQAGINVPGTIPTWLEEMFDIEEEDESNIHGMFTKKYYESSFGNLHLIGDFIVVNIPQSYVIAGVQGSNGTFDQGDLIDRTIEYINDNDGLETVYGHNSIADYKLPVGDQEIHFGSAIIRNSKPNYGNYAAGTGSMFFNSNPILFNDHNSYPVRAGLLFCSGDTESWVLELASVMYHEMGHALIGPDNNMHYGGGNGWDHNSGRVFLQMMGGYGLMGQSSTGLVSANAFDRWWLHWKSPIYNTTDSYIAASNQVSDISVSDGNKTFILRDFVTTGDAVRIKLPYVDAGAKNQYIWLENHKIGTNGKLDFLTYSNFHDCRPQGKPGIYAYYQVGKDILTGEGTVIRPSGQSDHLKPISAEGNFNYSTPNPAYKVFDCVMDTLQRARKNDPNPFMGTNDIMAHFKNTGNNPLTLNDAFGAFSKNHYANGQWIDNDSLPYLMDERDPFRGECFFNLSTNPAPVPTTTYYNEVSGININKETITDNNTIYLSGLSIFMVPLANGDYKVSIDWNRNTVENDVVWTGKIALTDRLYVSNGSVVELKQNLTPCQVDKDLIANQYSPVTEFLCKENSLMTFSGRSMMDVSEKSKIHILSSSVTTFEDHATLTIKAGSELIVESCANLVLIGQAKLIVEPGGILTIKQGGNVFIDDIANLDLQNGFIIGSGGISINMTNALFVLGTPPINTITTNTTWSNTNYNFFDDLYIAPGATLTLSNTELKFFRTAKVKVARGGKLEMTNNSNLTTACNSELWAGVEVWGNPSVSQIPATNQGHLVMNNSKIEFARTGVLLDKPMYPTDNPGTPGVPSGNGGGIIQAVNSSFTNNYIGVSFSPYVNDNVSSFSNCTFSANGVFPEIFTGIDCHANLIGVIGIDFLKCTFTLETGIKNNAGIRSYNSNFLVDGIISNHKYQRSLFENMEHGIYAISSLSNRNYTVRNTVFKKCIKGIFASGVNNMSITNNMFAQPMQNVFPTYNRVGIYLEYCTGYTIQYDTIICFTGNNAKSEVGMYIKNSGPHENLIYNNGIIHMNEGIIIEGENRNGDSEGLCIKCNVFQNNKNDVRILPGENTWIFNQGIKQYQGSQANDPKAPAGNIFSNYPPNGFFNIDNELCRPIEYFHHPNNIPNFVIRPPDNKVRIFGKTVILTLNGNNPFDRTLACPPIPNHADSKEELISGALLMDDAIAETKSELVLLTDDGDTPLKVNNINSSAPFEALWLHDELLGASPYLSDTALVKAAEKEDVLNSALIRDVMVANPHSAKSNKVIEALELRSESLPESIWAEINAGRNQISARQALEISISDLSAEKALSRNLLLQAYQNDNKNDSLRWLMNQIPDALSAYKSAWTWFDEGNTGYGLTAIQNVDLTTIPENHRSYQNGYVQVAEIIKQLATDTSYFLQNDTTALITLQTLAVNDNPAGISARNLLTAYRLMSYEAVVPAPDTTLKSLAAEFDKPKKAKDDKTTIHVFPNPASDYTIVSYAFEESGMVELLSHDGRVIRSENLKAGKNQYLLRTGGLPSGVYTVKVSGGKKTLTTKLIIQ
ncbi:MAG: hypothetical protein FD170_3242 [Bacteroidetes bacterium]|nr:MAG: hypothetical protein FD170_3242 [Bacteroidota bacterium]